MRRWKREARPGFIYTVKVNRTITHERRMSGTEKLVSSFYKIAETLEEKMGCFPFSISAQL